MAIRFLFILILSFSARELVAQPVENNRQRSAADNVNDRFVQSMLRYQGMDRNGSSVLKGTDVTQRIVAQSYSRFSEYDTTYYGYTDPGYPSAYDYGNTDMKLSYTQWVSHYYDILQPVRYDAQFYFRTEPDAIADTIHYREPQGYWDIKALSYYNADHKVDSLIEIQNTSASTATNYQKCLIFRDNDNRIDSVSHSISLDNVNYEHSGSRYFRYNASGQILLDSFSYTPNPQIYHRFTYHYDNNGNIDTVTMWDSGDTAARRIYYIGYDTEQRIDTLNLYLWIQGDRTENRYAFKYTDGIAYATYIEESKIEFPASGPSEYWYWNKIYKYPRPDGKIDSVVYYRELSGGFVRNQASHYTYNTLGNPQYITHYTPINYFTSDTLMGKSIFYYDHTNDVDTGTATGISLPGTQSLPGIDVYPNPFSGFFQLKTQDKTETFHIALYDMSGVQKLYADGTIASLNHTLRQGVKSLSPGNYLLLIRDGKGQRKEFKIVKDK